MRDNPSPPRLFEGNIERMEIEKLENVHNAF